MFRRRSRLTSPYFPTHLHLFPYPIVYNQRREVTPMTATQMLPRRASRTTPRGARPSYPTCPLPQNLWLPRRPRSLRSRRWPFRCHRRRTRGAVLSTARAQAKCYKRCKPRFRMIAAPAMEMTGTRTRNWTYTITLPHWHSLSLHRFAPCPIAISSNKCEENSSLFRIIMFITRFLMLTCSAIFDWTSSVEVGW